VPGEVLGRSLRVVPWGAVELHHKGEVQGPIRGAVWLYACATYVVICRRKHFNPVFILLSYYMIQKLVPFAYVLAGAFLLDRINVHRS
jgi:hypothetical protein